MEKFKEEFLNYLWKYRFFDQEDLRTTKGESITIKRPGWHNTDAGPDFFLATIDIGGTSWAGNVEIHIRSSHWIQHQHHEDPKYDNVILHVVYEDDIELPVRNASIPVLELKDRIPRHMLENYLSLVQFPDDIKCAHKLKELDEFTWKSWTDRLLVERLERKTGVIQSIIEKNQGDLQSTFYHLLFRTFGFRVNETGFDLLYASLPAGFFRREQDLLQIEALMFGQSGLLPDGDHDAYASSLKKEYGHLKNKYGLTPLNAVVWNALRLRPPNFPAIRISQLAAVMKRSSQLFDLIGNCGHIAAFRDALTCHASEYWDEHYVFSRSSRMKKKNLGDSAIDLILINCIIPFSFFYGRELGKPEISAHALNLLEQLGPERNHLTDKFEAYGILNDSAASSQALIQLGNNYCKTDGCLQCAVGNFLIKKM